MNQIGDAFALALKQMLKERRLSISSAAKTLEVSRQTFHSYLNGVLPRRRTLSKAVHVWDLKLDLGRHSFDRGAFGGELGQGGPAPRATQRTLWEMLDSLTEEDLHLTVKRVGKILRVDVKIEIPA